jgi:erythromycin esterase-like protein
MTEEIRRWAKPLRGGPRDYDDLLSRIGDAHLVLLGEASHGTHEFYRERAEITKRLIVEKHFTAVAVEADWPDAYRVNRFVRGISEDQEAIEALDDFKRFPTWMWRNADVLDFVGWLREHNQAIASNEERVGFYGLDLYSLFSSIEAVINYLEKVDPEAARRARQRYSCFDHFGEDSQTYGYATTLGLTSSCEEEVVHQLIEFRKRAAEYATRDGHIPPDEAFFAEQNARVVRNAERYYRAMFGGRISSWNLRDQHMFETLENLLQHIRGQGRDAKIAVWEHNSHLGDARATEMGRRGELNVGQLVRQHHGTDSVLVGFTTYTGTVTAATDWDEAAERKQVRPALPESYEALFHEVEQDAFLLNLHHREILSRLQPERLERAIGVIYRPETERLSHYFLASLPRQFDAVLHFDHTRAVEPLERFEKEHTAEVPETYPHAV